jgi:hypothetical protein
MSSEAQKAKQRAYYQANKEKIKARREEKKENEEWERWRAEEERNAKKKAIKQIYREKVKANKDKKAIQREYEASNPILQEERKAHRDAEKSSKK